MTPGTSEAASSATMWTSTDLDRIGRSQELDLASRRPDGTLDASTTMWVVSVGGELYVRSAGGPGRPWFRRARTAGSGRIRAGGVEADVQFAEATVDVQAAIDAAYHDKYDRYGADIVGHVTGPDAHRVTVRLVPTAGVRSET